LQVVDISACFAKSLGLSMGWGRGQKQTLNQRVHGSSPCAPTIDFIGVSVPSE
jgi:hypothetical protein